MGTLLTFTLTALSTVPNGVGEVIIQQNYGNTNTVVYDGNTGSAIVLARRQRMPSNPTVDATVTVGTIPEPSSLVLMGLDGLITATTLLRKKARLAGARRSVLREPARIDRCLSTHPGPGGADRRDFFIGGTARLF